jgi:hypothetical protein
MRPSDRHRFTRRDFIAGSSALGAASLFGIQATAANEPPPETRRFFYALRLHDVGMIKSTPQQLIAQGTDWRFLNELKRELKA